MSGPGEPLVAPDPGADYPYVSDIYGDSSAGKDGSDDEMDELKQDFLDYPPKGDVRDLLDVLLKVRLHEGDAIHGNKMHYGACLRCPVIWLA